MAQKVRPAGAIFGKFQKRCILHGGASLPSVAYTLFRAWVPLRTVSFQWPFIGIIRRTIERVSRNKVFWRRLPKPFSIASILVTPDASLSYLRAGSGWCDPEVLKVATEFVKAGDVVWDIGANVGIFAVAASVSSGPSGRVLCVEPDVGLAQLIRRTDARQTPQCARIETLVAAVADCAGIAEFQIAQRGRASNSLARFGGRSQMGGVRERVLSPVITLDAILQVHPSPNFIKIDVEGAKAVIFDGATRVLKESRPTIYVEVGDQNIDKVTGKLHDECYDLFDPSKPVAGQAPLPMCLWNTLAIPRKL